MDSSCCMGVMAVMAVSGSVALFAVKMHRRLENEFMRRFESEFGGGGSRGIERWGRSSKRRVRFADDVVEPSSDNKEYRRRHSRPPVANYSTATTYT